jgi:8-oxo-dGTP pyrophosphatase MutT (NUDIX family)
MSVNYWKPNATVAAVIEQNGRFLMIEESTRNGLKINQPAGHLDPGESLIDAVERETMEETAYRVRATALLGVYMSRYVNLPTNTDVTYLRFAFVCEVITHEPNRPLDHGIQQAMWLTPAQVKADSERFRSPLVLTTIDDYLSGKRYPLSAIFTHPSSIYTQI